MTRNPLCRLALRTSAEVARALGPRGKVGPDDIDAETRLALAELGLDLERDSVEAVSGRLGLRGSALEQWSQLAALRADESDAWAVGSEDLIRSASGPTPIEFVGDLETDPLVFTFELRKPATPAQIKSLSNWAEAIGRLESDDDEDHVSSWSDARPVVLSGARHGVMWHYDAAVAGPDTVRRLIEAASAYGAHIRPAALRLLVGHVDRVANSSTAD